MTEPRRTVDPQIDGLTLIMKRGVDFSMVDRRLVWALWAIAEVWYIEAGVRSTTVTSLADGNHMPASWHYTTPCRAADVRWPRAQGPQSDDQADAWRHQLAIKAQHAIGPRFELVVRPGWLHVELERG